MDIRKYQFNIFCLLLFPLSATGQEWNKQDSLRLQQMLESGQEIKINRKFIEKVEQNMYSRKPFVDFDPTLPTLKSSMIFSKPSIRTYQTFLKPGSTFLPTYPCFYFPVFTYFENNITTQLGGFHFGREAPVFSGIKVLYEW